MMHRQSYPRFLQSEMFHSILQTTYAYNPNSPKPPQSLSATPRTASEKIQKTIEKQPQSGAGSHGNSRQSSPTNELTLANPHHSSPPLQKDNTSSENRHSRSFVSPNQLSPASLHENPVTHIGNFETTNKQLDRHNSMPTNHKGQQTQKLKLDNKLGPRNSSNT